MQEITMTIEIRQFVLKVVTDQALTRWLVLAAALAATVVVNAPISGGGGV
jgi:hypothetical protein